MSKSTLALLREFISEIMLSEAPVNLQVPKDKKQADAFIDMLLWAGEKMQATQEEVDTAVEKAKDKNDWSDALDLISTYFVMKGIKFKRQ
jgi:hypothetical protein